MLRSFLITTPKAGSGKHTVIAGLLNYLCGKFQRVARCESLSFPPPYRRGLSLDSSIQVPDQVLYSLVEHFENVSKDHDFTVICSRDSNTDHSVQFELDLCAALNLSIPVIVVLEAAGKTNRRIFTEASDTIAKARLQKITIIALIVNGLNSKYESKFKGEVTKLISKDCLVGFIPAIDGLDALNIKHIQNRLGGTILFGNHATLRTVSHVLIGVKNIMKLLSQLQENTLLILPKDTDDLLVAAVAVSLSTSCFKLSGILLTGGWEPGRAIMKLIKGVFPVITIISTLHGPAASLSAIKAILPKPLSYQKKESLAIDAFLESMDTAHLDTLLIKSWPQKISKAMFSYSLLKQCESFKAKIVFTEGLDERILRAATKAVRLGLIQAIFLGDEKNIRQLFEEIHINLNLQGITIIDPKKNTYSAEYAALLCRLRKKQNMSVEQASGKIQDPSYFGTLMVYLGHADGLLGGAVYTTRQTILPALEIIKAKKGKTLVSSVFFMCLKDRVVAFGDCAVNPDPSAEELAEIAISASDTARVFGIEPRVAMISYSSGSSGIGKSVNKVRTATDLVKAKRPDLMIEGPIQYDAAVDPQIANSKMQNSPVAGKATVLIFPNLDAANSIYKAVQQEAAALAIGPILQELDKPVNDLSRGASEDDIFNAILVTAIQAKLSIKC